MSESTPSVPDAVRASLQNSGFPFQTAVTHAVAAKAREGWAVYASEFPWQSLDGETRFLDLVAALNASFYLAIECKRTRKEIFTFLRPVGLSDTGPVERFRCLHAEQVQDSTKRLEVFCEEWALHPRSTESEFCVVSTSDSGKDQRLLERDAGLLVNAADALADTLRGRFVPDMDAPAIVSQLVLPVIVTNAPLYSARYRPTDISLESGQFHGGSAGD